LAAKEEKSGEMRDGVVVRVQSGHCLVVADGEPVRCRLRGRLKKGPQVERSPVVAGDRVRLRLLPATDSAGPAGVVEEVMPRRNRISRSSRRSGGRVEHVLMANLDQVVAVQSLRRPEPSPAFVDRLLVAAERYGVAGVLCLNKIDLDPEGAADPRWDYYARTGYEVVRTSAETGEGLEDLRRILQGRISLLLGQSGVGKSSLLQILQPGLRLRTGDVGEKTGLGRHITTRTELFALDGGGFIADSPGIRGFDSWDIEPIELRDHLPDLTGFALDCRFASCLHRDEPDCGVKRAVTAGQLPDWRYQAYLAMLGSLEERSTGGR